MNSVPTFLVAAAGFLLLVIGMVVVLPRMEDRVDEPGEPAAGQSGPDIGWPSIRRSPRGWARRMPSSHRLVPGRGRRRGALQGVRSDEVPAD